MDIPNLTNPQVPTRSFSLPILGIILVVALTSGFWLSRFFPFSAKNVSGGSTLTNSSNTVSTDKISNAQDLKVGVVYGNNDPNCKDTATGSIEAGSINGEGTHILNRPGGKDQRASLTSSTVDLDLFVGKTVTVTGQTNSSKKTGWLLDVCSLKINN